MTKEELEKEAEDKGVEYADKQKRTISVHEDSGYSWGQIEEAYERGALDFAEPREKQIEILSKHILELQADKGRLTDMVRELEAQIEKMKCCYNCSKWYYGECEESPKSKTFFCADFKCDNWEIADD